MRTKVLEVRDRATFIPVLAVKLGGENGFQDKLLEAAGYSRSGTYVLLTKLAGGICTYDPYKWGNRTMAHAHLHIHDCWEDLRDGDVVDVEFILGETTVKKAPQ